MAGADTILARLLDLQGTNFEVVDCQVKDEEIVWRAQHRDNPEYICSRCEARVDACHDMKWITLYDVPFGKRRCKWLVKGARILCVCSMSVRVEKLPFRARQHQLTQRFVDLIEQVLCTKMFTVARLFDLDYSVVYKIDHEVLRRLVQNAEIPDPIKLKSLTEFAEYIKRNTQILLNIIRTGRSSAISEGINRKISVIKAMAYGYRNVHYFMLKILQRCGVLGIRWTPAQN